MTQAVAVPDPLLLVPARRAAQMCGKSVRTWRALHAGGLVPSPVRIGRSLLWRVRDLEAWTAEGCPPRDTFECAE